MIDETTLALFRIGGVATPQRFRLVVEPDGRTGFIHTGGLGSVAFRYLGESFEGGIGFRAIVGRNFHVDDVRFSQTTADGSETVILEDDFNRDCLGPRWIKESLIPGAAPQALSASIEAGGLEIVHDGTMNDTWLRPNVSVRFAGKTTVFEFTLVERSGDLGGNPALVVGTRAFEPGKTCGVMLIDVRGAEPTFTHGMVNGAWRTGQAETIEDLERSSEIRYERVKLPTLEPNEKKTATDLGLQPATYLRYSTVFGGTSPWHGGRSYVDLLRPGAGEEFLQITLGAYDRVLDGEYGKSVLACFTDEPHTSGGWTARLPETFQALFGYSVLDHLPALHYEVGPWRAVRHDYAATILSLFLDHFAKPYFEACEKRGIAATGHVWEHGWPQVGHGSDVMSFNAWQHIPGIDCLMNQYSEGPHAQFGNFRALKEIRSIANQLGRVRTLCEAYGAAGWEVSFEDLKRIGDWLCVGGVNFLNPHLSYYTIRGARKADHPPSFSYHEPWWEAHHLLADYFGRLCWALAAGEERNDILVIEPTTTMWMYNFSRATSRRLEELGSAFQAYVTELAAAQVGFDLGSEPVMAERSRVEGGCLIVGQRSYSVVILPPGLENLERSTLELMEEFTAQGGRVVSYVEAPALVNGREEIRPAKLAEAAGERWIAAAAPYGNTERALVSPAVAVTAEASEGGRVYHHLREFEDGYLLFVVNTSLEKEACCSFTTEAGRVEVWNLVDGSVEPTIPRAQKQRHGGTELPGIGWDLELPPAGSALCAVWTEGEPTLKTPVAEAASAPASCRVASGPDVKRLDPNVLVLDFMDLVIDGELSTGLYRSLPVRRADTGLQSPRLRPQSVGSSGTVRGRADPQGRLSRGLRFRAALPFRDRRVRGFAAPRTRGRARGSLRRHGERPPAAPGAGSIVARPVLQGLCHRAGVAAERRERDQDGGTALFDPPRAGAYLPPRRFHPPECRKGLDHGAAAAPCAGFLDRPRLPLLRRTDGLHPDFCVPAGSRTLRRRDSGEPRRRCTRRRERPERRLHRLAALAPRRHGQDRHGGKLCHGDALRQPQESLGTPSPRTDTWIRMAECLLPQHARWSAARKDVRFDRLRPEPSLQPLPGMSSAGGAQPLGFALLDDGVKGMRLPPAKYSNSILMRPRSVAAGPPQTSTAIPFKDAPLPGRYTMNALTVIDGVLCAFLEETDPYDRQFIAKDIPHACCIIPTLVDRGILPARTNETAVRLAAFRDALHDLGRGPATGKRAAGGAGLGRRLSAENLAGPHGPLGPASRSRIRE